jgi:hypothetical protein
MRDAGCEGWKQFLIKLTPHLASRITNLTRRGGRYKMLTQTFSEIATAATVDPEVFWRKKAEFEDTFVVLRYSFAVSFFVFAGFLFNYTIVGQIWNLWPFEHTTLTVGRAIPCAILQWVLYATFPLTSTFFIDAVVSRKSSHQESKQRLIITAYALTPLCLSLLFVGIPFLDKALVVLGIAMFLYSLFYGYRIVLNQTILRSFFMTMATYAFYEILRNVFVYVIGF